ncbi:MAG: MerR family transcriptional regulator [Acidobacteriota bacterium]
MDDTLFKVGELAERIGVTVRTLHHYDEIGLLRPARRSSSGHRQYDSGDLERLQRITSLRQLGFSLDQIGEALDGERFPIAEVVALHLQAMRQLIDHQHRLCDRFEGLLSRLGDGEELSVDDLLGTLEETAMIERHFTPEQLRDLAERGRRLGADRIEAVENEWPELIAAVTRARDGGRDPADPEVQALARRWRQLVEAFTGGDPEVERSVQNLYEQEPAARERSGIDPELMAYVGKAMAAAAGAG